MKKTRLILVGGFLGAGKTTLILKAAEKLRGQGLTVGLVTNDQAAGLVDTALAERMDLNVTEVAGGCFCCSFDDLMKSIDTLEREVKPDVILAEPVGSCTDLMATVMRPLSLYHGDRFDLAPFTVLSDPNRDLEEFDETVSYLYDRQLYEADAIVLTKSKITGAERLKEVQERLHGRYPDVRLITLSAKEDIGFDAWLDHVMHQISAVDRTMDLDYERYTKAEAVLGWLNARGSLKSHQKYSPTAWIATFASSLRNRMKEINSEIAHFKIFLSQGNNAYKASLTGMDSPLAWDSFSEDQKGSEGMFIVNARVNISPEDLETEMRQLFRNVCQKMGIQEVFQELRSFSPPPPEPTHRITTTL